MLQPGQRGGNETTAQDGIIDDLPQASLKKNVLPCEARKDQGVLAKGSAPLKTIENKELIGSKKKKKRKACGNASEGVLTQDKESKRKHWDCSKFNVGKTSDVPNPRAEKGKFKQ